MANPNADKLKKIGLDVWHDLGYNGELGLSATAEKLVVDRRTDGWWTSPIYPAGGSDHALSTALVFHTFAPKRRLVSLPATNAKNQDGLYFASHSAQYILNNGIDTLFCSMSSGDTSDMDNYLGNLPYLFYVNSAGNGGETGTYNTATRNRWIFGVGALNAKTEQPPPYSSHSPYIDFSMFDNVYIESSKGTFYPFNGTSCSAPALAGVAACVNHFFILKTGKPLLKEKMYQFLKDCSKDIWDEGKDDRTGWGLPVLPHPNSVDIEKYATKGGEEDMYFKDIQDHWAKLAINAVTDAGYMNGYTDGTFRPDRPLTRAELAQVLYNLKIKGDEK